jgi:integrase
MLLGARLNEAAGARWSEFDFERKLWRVPAERFKSEREHVVPLTQEMLALLADLPRWPEGQYLFSVRRGKPVRYGYSHAKAKAEALVAKELGDTPPRWVLHDLRRTVRTRLSELGVPSDVAERVIGHEPQGLLRVYDRHSYSKEIRQPLERWNARLRAIVEPPPDNVVPLRVGASP